MASQYLIFASLVVFLSTIANLQELSVKHFSSLPSSMRSLGLDMVFSESATC